MEKPDMEAAEVSDCFYYFLFWLFDPEDGGDIVVLNKWL
jgi:hypothetical protein